MLNASVVVVGNYEYTLKSVNMDYKGYDLGQVQSQDVKECAAKCNGTPLCMGISIDTHISHCWLKSKMDAGTPNKRDVYVKTQLR